MSFSKVKGRAVVIIPLNKIKHISTSTAYLVPVYLITVLLIAFLVVLLLFSRWYALFLHRCQGFKLLGRERRLVTKVTGVEMGRQRCTQEDFEIWNLPDRHQSLEAFYKWLIDVSYLRRWYGSYLPASTRARERIYIYIYICMYCIESCQKKKCKYNTWCISWTWLFNISATVIALFIAFPSAFIVTNVPSLSPSCCPVRMSVAYLT